MQAAIRQLCLATEIAVVKPWFFFEGRIGGLPSLLDKTSFLKPTRTIYRKSGCPAGGVVKPRLVSEESNEAPKITTKEPRQIRSEPAFATAEVKPWLSFEG